MGPVLGGALAYAAGWEWIFWFLTIVTVSGLAIVGFCLPETSRSIVGNGAIKPPKVLRLPIPLTTFMQHYRVERTSKAGVLRVPNPLRSLKILFRRDNAVVVLAWGLMYAVYSVYVHWYPSSCFEHS